MSETFTFELPLAWAKRSATAVFVVEVEPYQTEDDRGNPVSTFDILSVKVPPGTQNLEKKLGVSAMRVLRDAVEAEIAKRVPMIDPDDPWPLGGDE